MTSETIFQVTDLAKNRVEFVEAARHGGARLRDKDGTSLLMLPESRVRVLQELSDWNYRYMRLESLCRRGDHPSISDLGELAWLRAFDAEDLREFISDLHDALLASRADDDLRALEDVVRDWRATAAQLDDPLRRSVLLGEVRPEDLGEAPEPHGE